MKTLVLNPSSGISGNMLLGALLDLGADAERTGRIVEETSRVFGCEVVLETQAVEKAGLRALWVDTRVQGDCAVSHGSVFKKKAAHLADTLLSTREGKAFAGKVVDTLLEAEARAHGEPLDHVHLHELGSPDTAIDILGCAAALEDLGITPGEKVYSSSVNVGSGTTPTAHGSLPVPPPATAEILREFQIPFFTSAEPQELTTPTGAALLANLVEASPPASRIVSIGRGAGTFETASPNVLQVILCETAGALKTEEVTVLETNLDDVTGEVLGNAVDVLYAMGALDVQLIPTITKKNRPGHILSLLCRDEDAEDLAAAIMAETGTLGVRVAKRQKRFVAEREEVQVDVELGNFRGRARVKVSKDAGGRVLKAKAEFDDALAISKKTGIPVREVIREIERRVNP
ncbi:MAG: nickel pincer cofactor biosynthesis protein LarC [Euryarchaeota archaeon]|nr:nickel pincer cofactor biosynthesis protein LarC [Euryarchaeota archaeon]